jgi:hypothetical protein
MKTKTKQLRLAQVAREIGFPYRMLHYHVSIGQTPVTKKVAYTPRDVESLRTWAEGRRKPPGEM